MAYRFVIEKGIPLPPPTVNNPLGRKARSAKWPWQFMDVGDSFVVPEEMEARCKSSASMYGKAAEKRGFKRRFTVRRQPDGSYRAWRTE